MQIQRCKTIWDVATSQDVVAVPTSIGWREDGRAVFGSGILRQVARRWPELPAWYGDQCRARCGDVPVIFWTPSIQQRSKWCMALALVPVRPLLVKKPHLSWLQEASVAMVSAGLDWLRQVGATSPPDTRFIMSLLGGLPSDKYPLNREMLLTLFEQHALDQRYVLADAEEA